MTKNLLLNRFSLQTQNRFFDDNSSIARSPAAVTLRTWFDQVIASAITALSSDRLRYGASRSSKPIEHPPNVSLPAALKEASERFPDRVKPALVYLCYQQQKRQIKNPAEYLYEAIVQG